MKPRACETAPVRVLDPRLGKVDTVMYLEPEQANLFVLIGYASHHKEAEEKREAGYVHRMMQPQRPKQHQNNKHRGR
jgi:hypothetical protein